jgi:hypothetical protein
LCSGICRFYTSTPFPLVAKHGFRNWLDGFVDGSHRF